MQINCRSIKKNFDKLKLLLNQFPKPPDVITLSETWINNPHLSKHFSINNYTLISHPRTNKKRGGGVAAYVSNKFPFTELSELSNLLSTACENCVIELEMAQGPNIIIASVYKAPDVDISLFITTMCSFLDELSTNNKSVFIAGEHEHKSA